MITCAYMNIFINLGVVFFRKLKFYTVNMSKLNSYNINLSRSIHTSIKKTQKSTEKPFYPEVIGIEVATKSLNFLQKHSYIFCKNI